VGPARERCVPSRGAQGGTGSEPDGQPERVSERAVLDESRRKRAVTGKGGGRLAGGVEQHSPDSQNEALLKGRGEGVGGRRKRNSRREGRREGKARTASGRRRAG
jgi:hypothetical protein